MPSCGLGEDLMFMYMRAAALAQESSSRLGGRGDGSGREEPVVFVEGQKVSEGRGEFGQRPRRREGGEVGPDLLPIVFTVLGQIAHEQHRIP